MHYSLLHQLKYWLERLRPPAYRTLDDDFIRRLRCSLVGEGMLHPGNVFAMAHAIRKMPEEGAVLEIGSYAGLSTNVLAYLLQKHRRAHPFFSCDAWIYEGFHDDSPGISPARLQHMDGAADISRDAYMQYIKSCFIRGTRFFSTLRLPHTFHLTSDAFFEKWKAGETGEGVFGRNAKLGGPLAFVYIDGNHAYEFAKRDVENSLSLLLPGGFLLLDDTADFLPYGSRQLARELQRDRRVELVMKNPNYLYRKAYKDKRYK